MPHNTLIMICDEDMSKMMYNISKNVLTPFSMQRRVKNGNGGVIRPRYRIRIEVFFGIHLVRADISSVLSFAHAAGVDTVCEKDAVLFS